MEKFDEDLSGKKIRNLVQKLTPATTDHTLYLEKFLEQIELEGGIVENTADSDGNVSMLFVPSDSMKKAFLDAHCTTLQIDTSFDFDSSKYKLCGFCYLNPTTNKSEFCASAFLSEVTACNFRSAFGCFRNMSSESPSVFIVDKDFNEISVLSSVFPNSTILLCNHVIKYVRNLIATAIATVEVKSDLMDHFKSIMYAHISADSYEERKDNFLKAVKGVEVRFNKKYVPLTEQFRNN